MRRTNFAAALTQLGASELRLTHLRLAPDRIDAQLLTRAGSLRSMQVKPGGKPASSSAPTRARASTGAHDPVRAPRPRRAAAPRPPRRGQAPRPGLDPAVRGPVGLQRQAQLGRVLQARALRARRRPRPLPAQLSLGAGPLQPAAVVAHAAALDERAGPAGGEREVQRARRAGPRRARREPRRRSRRRRARPPPSSARSASTCSGSK